MKFANLLIFGLISLLSFSRLDAGGIIAVKEQSFHNDSSAVVFLYEKIEFVGPFVRIHQNGKRPYSYKRSQPIVYVDFLDKMPVSILNEEQIRPLKTQLTKLQEFSQRFEKSQPYLLEKLNSLKSYINHFDEGKVLTGGEWISKEQHEKNLAEKREEMAREREEARLEEEKILRKKEMEKLQQLEFENTQRSKGLVKYKGKWIKKSIAELRKYEDDKKDRVNREIRKNMLSKASFSVFQFLDSGDALIKTSNNGVISIMHLADSKDYNLVSDRSYTADLFYRGIYTYINRSNETRKTHSYFLNPEKAYRFTEEQLYPTKSNEDSPVISENPDQSEDSDKGIFSGVKSVGSGFFIGDSGFFVTNYHVIDGCSDIKIHHNGQLLKAELSKFSEKYDIAILATGKKVTGLPIFSENVMIGSDVFALGFPQPRIQGIGVKVTKGVISGVDPVGSDNTKYQIDASIQPGNSGGPVCDQHGRVVGIVVSKLDEIKSAIIQKNIPQNVNYAIKSSVLVKFLKQEKISSNVETTKVVDDSDQSKILAKSIESTAMVLGK